MRTKMGASRRGVSVKVAAVVLIVLLEVTAVLYLYMNPVQGESQNPFVIPTSTATTKSTTTSTTTRTTTPKPVDHVSVESAMISNDTLKMEVDNLGPSATNSLTVTSVCSPGFQTCYDYKKLAGAYYQTKFVLPAGRTFMANLTGVCIVAIKSCKSYLPVANSTYYVQVTFGFANGGSVQVPVSAMANNTWSPYLTAVTGIWPSMTIVPANLTGLLNVTLTVNDSLPYASWTTLLEGYAKPANPFSGTILSNETGCVGSADINFTADGRKGGAFLNSSHITAACASPEEVLFNFTTVLTAIAPGTNYLLVIRDTTDVDSPANYPNYDGPNHTFVWESNFALWIQGTVK